MGLPQPHRRQGLLGQNKQKKRATARMHQRIRELAPLLPALVDAVDRQRRHAACRPSVEYREPTDAEWDEFLGHFERRKVELGVCGRAYGTPCQHEHACIRCPMLRSDPRQLGRLSEIIENLDARLAEAHELGWLGEVEGLEGSLGAARQKLTSMQRAVAATGATNKPAAVMIIPNRSRAHQRTPS